jgi:hypothetical protein
MKGTIKILDGSGHSTVEYDTETGEGVKDATATLQQGTRNRSAVFDAKTREKINNPVVGTHEEMLVIPPMAGG